MTGLDATEVARQLREFILGQLLEQPDYPLGDDEPLVTGGLIDSFSIAHIGVFIEQQFGVYIPDPELTVENMDTVRRIAESVVARAAAEAEEEVPG